MGKTAIFDFDGLMVNSEEVVFEALRQMFRERDAEFAWEYYCHSLGLPVADSIAMYLRDIPIGVTVEAFTEERNELVAAYMETRLRLMPGLVPLLEALTGEGITLAVATSGKRAYVTRQLERFGIAHYFATLVCVEDVERGKPHPDLVLKALAVTRTRSEDAAMLEDSPNGAEAAHRAGVRCIAVPTRGLDHRRFATAEVIVDDLAAAHETFRRWGWIGTRG